MIQYHEAWRDEAQAWCLVKGSDFSGIFQQLSAEGHPILWFAFLYPFAHLGFKFAWLSYLTLGVSAVAAAVFLFKAPFKVPVKIILLCSSIFSFYNPVVARVYALSLLIIVLIGSIYQDRHRKSVLYCALIALLFQTHIILAGLAIGLTISYIYEICKNRIFTRSNICSILFPFSSLILLICELWQRSDDKVFIDVTKDLAISRFNIEQIRENLIKLSHNLFYISRVDDRYYTIMMYAILTFLLVFIAELFWTFIKTKSDVLSELIISICGIGYYFVIIIFVRGADHEQLAICFMMILFIVMWMSYGKIRVSAICFHVFVSLSILSVISIAKYDYFNDYSMSRNMAEYIIYNIEENAVIYVDDDQSMGVPLSYLDDYGHHIEYKSANTDTEHKFFSWAKIYPNINEAELLSRMKEDSRTREVYYLGVDEIDCEDLLLIYAADESDKWDEKYYLYKYE